MTEKKQADSTIFSEEQIRPSALMRDKEKCLEADFNFLLSQPERWQKVRCPVCEDHVFSCFGEKRGIVYVKCDRCQMVYTNPRPSMELLRDFYVQSQNYAYWNDHIFPASETVRREKIFRPRAERILGYCQRFGKRGGALLEVGAAFGTFCEEMRSLNWFDRIVAIEPTPNLAETCRKRGLEVLETSIEEAPQQEIADVVTAFEVIEHLFCPNDFIAKCRDLLTPSGILVITCPNVSGFDLLTLGVLSGSFDHEHLNYFSPSTLSSLLKRNGFDILAAETPGALDVELVRKTTLTNAGLLDHQPFLKEVILTRYEELAGPFQTFLAEHHLSSHLWVVARKQL